MVNACLLICWSQLAHNIPNYLETSKNQENSGCSISHHNDIDRQRLTAKLQCWNRETNMRIQYQTTLAIVWSVNVLYSTTSIYAVSIVIYHSGPFTFLFFSDI